MKKLTLDSQKFTSVFQLHDFLICGTLVRRVERRVAHRVQTSSVLKMRSQKIEPRNQIENSTRPKWIKFGMNALL